MPRVGVVSSAHVTSQEIRGGRAREGWATRQDFGFGASETRKIINFLQNDPHCGPILNEPVSFDPKLFPPGEPSDD